VCPFLRVGGPALVFFSSSGAPRFVYLSARPSFFMVSLVGASSMASLMMDRKCPLGFPPNCARSSRLGCLRGALLPPLAVSYFVLRPANRGLFSGDLSGRLFSSGSGVPHPDGALLPGIKQKGSHWLQDVQCLTSVKPSKLHGGSRSVVPITRQAAHPSPLAMFRSSADSLVDSPPLKTSI